MEVNPLRIAFLTSEFISEKKSGGGLGNYLNRMTQALKDSGHIPEVFVVSTAQPLVIDFNGIRVQRVPPTRNIPLSFLSKLSRKLPILTESPWGGPEAYLTWAYSLSQAFKQRHTERPFNFVQSTNCHATGLFLPRLPNCPHLVRMSSKRDLWFSTDGWTGRGTALMSHLERVCVRRADIAYAPSRFVAERCREDHWREDVRVLRPPVFIETEPSPGVPACLPERFLIHFGQFGERKGSFVLARALCQVWKQVPDFKMVWAGRPIRQGDYEFCHQLWGEHSVNVLWLGSLEKSVLYAVLKRSEASVLPSKVDNLPNTVIESLLFGIPVIGFRGGSVDELVESGVSGELVEMDNEEALADAIVRAWQDSFSSLKMSNSLPEIFREFEPEQAVSGLLQLAGYENHVKVVEKVRY